MRLEAVGDNPFYGHLDVDALLFGVGFSGDFCAFFGAVVEDGESPDCGLGGGGLVVEGGAAHEGEGAVPVYDAERHARVAQEVALFDPARAGVHDYGVVAKLVPDGALLGGAVGVDGGENGKPVLFEEVPKFV